MTMREIWSNSFGNRESYAKSRSLQNDTNFYRLAIQKRPLACPIKINLKSVNRNARSAAQLRTLQTNQKVDLSEALNLSC